MIKNYELEYCEAPVGSSIYDVCLDDGVWYGKICRIFPETVNYAGVDTMQWFAEGDAEYLVFNTKEEAAERCYSLHKG